MRILIATDAWHPQINGVVRTLDTTVGQLRALGHEVAVIGPDIGRTMAMPGYPEIRVAVRPARVVTDTVESFGPESIHIPVEGPIGLATRRLCLARGWRFTTSFHTRLGTYLRRRYGLPEGPAFAFQRWFHNAGAGLMVQADSLERELTERGFHHIQRWSRGVDCDLFRPLPRDTLGLKRPIFGYVGRVSAEKNIEAFLDLDLPGTKLVVGDGPQRPALEARYPGVVWAGFRSGEDLARYYSELDAFVMASRFETFGMVVLEALACGTPVAALPVHGPIDILGGSAVGVLDEDLRAAAMAALDIPRDPCRTFAEGFSWRRCTEQFLANLVPIGPAHREMSASLNMRESAPTSTA